ncbi:MAG TPA: response regulator transcription factor [Ignavibacteria bacterium]|nr:response regulator transcription factor [Ignavibacteria bacterium]
MSSKQKIKVAIVEDKKDIRNNIEILLNNSDSIKCIKTFPNSETAVEHIPRLKPDVILMDLNLPGKSGIECTKILKSKIPETQIIILTMYNDSEMVYQALSSGASGYLLKRTTSEQLIESIKEVFKGGSPMSMEIARMVVNSFSKKDKNKKVEEKLTKREWEILGLLSKGMKYKEIGEQLFISVETVRNHLRHIYSKLHVRSGTEAVLKYLNK